MHFGADFRNLLTDIACNNNIYLWLPWIPDVLFNDMMKTMFKIFPPTQYFPNKSGFMTFENSFSGCFAFMVTYYEQKSLALLIFQNAVENFELRTSTELSFKEKVCKY